MADAKRETPPPAKAGGGKSTADVLKSLTSGGVAGIVSRTAVAPLEVSETGARAAERRLTVGWPAAALRSDSRS